MFKKKNRILIALVILFEILLFCLFTVLFYFQADKHNGIYSSDLPAHIKFALEKRGYSLLYYIMRSTYGLIGSVFAIAILESLMWVGTQVMAGVLVKRLSVDISWMKAWLISIISMFLSGIYVPVFYEYFYRKQLVTQPYHNITYIGMRFFSVCAMIVFVKMFDNYLEKIEWKSWCLLSLFLLLSIAVKPNFWLGFSFTLLLFLVADFCKYRFSSKKFIHMIYLGTAVVPSILILLIQTSILYGKSINEGGTEIIVVWGKFFIGNLGPEVVLKLLCSLLFPLLIAIVNRKNLKRIDKFIYIMFFVQLGVAVLFAESGKRSGHGNFYWGVYCAGFFLFLLAIIKFVENFQEYRESHVIYKITGSTLLAAHFLSGLAYFVIVCSGKSYFV